MNVRSYGRLIQCLLSILALGMALIASDSWACTGIRISPKDGSVIPARTLEFAVNLKSNIIVIPRGHEFVGLAPGNKAGLRWKMKYASTGANGFGAPIIVDGLNEMGLYIGLFFFPDYADYQTIAPDEISKALAPHQLSNYLLGVCADVQEAVAAATKVRVGNVVFKEMGEVLTVHFILHDKKGKCVVIEYVKGQMNIYDNPLGVLTNSPTFDWHLTNLRNYINLTVTNVPPKEISDIKLTALGQGTGMLGLPGDFTPPSRFVRAVAFSQTAVPVDTARQGVLQAFHLLNQFDLPKGSIRGDEDGKMTDEYTEWTSAADLMNLRYHFRTFANSQIRMVDLKKVNKDEAKIMTISMQGEEVVKDVTETAR